MPASESSRVPDPAPDPTVLPVPAAFGAVSGRLLPGPDDLAWAGIPIEVRRQLRMGAHQLVTPVR
jgi:hypothetical protein